MKNNRGEVEQRLTNLMRPIDTQIMMCDEPNDILMMACGMLQRVGEIFESQLGKDGAQSMFENMINEKYRSGHNERKH